MAEVYVEFLLNTCQTGIGHGTDIAGMLGLSGENFKKIDTDKIDAKIAEIKKFGKLILGAEKEIPFIYGNIWC